MNLQNNQPIFVLNQFSLYEEGKEYEITPEPATREMYFERVMEQYGWKRSIYTFYLETTDYIIQIGNEVETLTNCGKFSNTPDYSKNLQEALYHFSNLQKLQNEIIPTDNVHQWVQLHSLGKEIKEPLSEIEYNNLEPGEIISFNK